MTQNTQNPEQGQNAQGGGRQDQQNDREPGRGQGGSIGEEE
ncbi:hypothetical protein [Luteimonas deserti]|nr:hypothetical protein [Luteimonas deserti]